MTAFVPVATLRRGGQAESHHFAAAAVVTPDGRSVARLGDADFATFARSALKPFQALPLVEAGGIERFGLDEGDLALICASHAGRPEHAEAARSLLRRGGFEVADLGCGSHRPLGEEARRLLDEAGIEPTSLHNNCSGKHAGMLLTCRLHGWSPTEPEAGQGDAGTLDSGSAGSGSAGSGTAGSDTAVSDTAASDTAISDTSDDATAPSGYLDPSHPLQRAIRQRVGRYCGLDPASLEAALDGCSAPTYSLPLSALALAYAGLAAPDLAPTLAGDGEADTALRDASREVVDAMTARPENVAGPGRFTTRLMQATRGRVLGKEGAEGVYAVAVRGPVALGVAVKIADGGERARDGVVIHLLRLLGVLSAEEIASLEDRVRPVTRNHRGFAVGEIVADFELERA